MKMCCYLLPIFNVGSLAQFTILLHDLLLAKVLMEVRCIYKDILMLRLAKGLQMFIIERGYGRIITLGRFAPHYIEWSCKKIGKVEFYIIKNSGYSEKKN